MNWNDYRVFDPDVDRPLSELPRDEAKKAYEHLMASKECRIEELRKLAAANGIDLAVEESLQQLNAWFVEHVQENPADPGRLTGPWYSVVNDISLYLGEKAIAESNGKLSWHFHTTDRSDMSYQRHVITGFDVENPSYYVDFDLLVGMYGHRVVGNQDVEADYFSQLVASALDKI